MNIPCCCFCEVKIIGRLFGVGTCGAEERALACVLGGHGHYIRGGKAITHFQLRAVYAMFIANFEQLVTMRIIAHKTDGAHRKWCAKFLECR